MQARALTVAILLMAGIVSALPAVRISDDRGGQIGAYLAKYHALRRSGQRVEIDGLCASACTMLLGTIPPDRICVTPRAVLAFHTAWVPTPFGDPRASSAGNRILWSSYPEKIRKWIERHGGLGPRIIYLRWPKLAAIYRPCR